MRVTPLERRVAASRVCGVNPAHVVGVGLRRAKKHWQLKPEFIPLANNRTAKPSSWRMRRTVAVNMETLTAIMAAEDLLDVCSKWSLIRGQFEPLVWQEIDRIIAELPDTTAQSECTPFRNAASDTTVWLKILKKLQF